jgi:hypothetical protein
MIVNTEALAQSTVSGWKRIGSTCETGYQLSMIEIGIATSLLLIQSIASGWKRKIVICDGKWQQWIDMKCMIQSALKLREKVWQNTPYEDCTCMEVVMPAITMKIDKGIVNS